MFTFNTSFRKRLLFSVLSCTLALVFLGSFSVLAIEYWSEESISLFERLPIHFAIITAISICAMATMIWIINKAIGELSKSLNELKEATLTATVDIYSNKRVETHPQIEISSLIVCFNQMLDTFASEKLLQQTAENRFRTFTAHAPIGIFQLDSSHNLVYANDQWYRITETHGEQNSWKAHQEKISDGDKPRYQSCWNHSLQKNTPILLEYQYQKNNKGHNKFLMENISPLQGGTGMSGVIGTLTDVTEIKQVQQQLEKLAFYDALTELPNRRFFTDLLSFGLAKAKRCNSKAAVLMLDLDNFKRVNDLVGHIGGDELLKVQAQRIRAAVREEDAVSRMGGDEFTIMLSPVHEITEVTSLSKRILDALNMPLVIGNHTIESGASIGVALYPNDGTAVDELIRNADMALYEAKGCGKNRVNFFSYKLDLEIRESVRIEQKLKYVIQRKGLQTFLQPQVSCDGKILWAEALIRWFDEDEGTISPCQFIPLAEETGLIHEIGQWMLEQICFHLSENKDYLNALGINGISVNLSGRQFYSRSLLTNIKRTLDEYGVNPEQLEFELTESSVMDDVNIAIDVMRGIQGLGCKIAIDDFGTGYSSLSYLKRFPINNLKIDKSFVVDIPHDSHGSAIATAIIAMAHKLDLGVVAEGVETKAQRDFLVNQGCKLLQGYLFAKPENIQTHVIRGKDLFFGKSTRIVRPH